MEILSPGDSSFLLYAPLNPDLASTKCTITAVQSSRILQNNYLLLKSSSYSNRQSVGTEKLNLEAMYKFKIAFNKVNVVDGVFT